MTKLQKPIIFVGIMLGAVGIPLAGGSGFLPGETPAAEADDPPSLEELQAGIAGEALLPVAPPHKPEVVVRTLGVIVTAYSSTVDQTDDDPFITASGNYVRDGIVATNLLPLGTKIRIPSIYGERVFIVDDRMHRRKINHVDIWFSSYWDAVNFGVKRATIEVLER